MGLWDRAVRRINQTPLAQGIESFGERQVKPLLRGIDADNATSAEIEGLAWTPNNLRGVSVRTDRNQPFTDELGEDRAFESKQQERFLKGLHKRTIPTGAQQKQAPISNEEPNLLGRLLISDVDDTAATQLLNDRNFAETLGTTPSELLAVRQQINDAAQAGAAIQRNQPRNPNPDAFEINTAGQDISLLLAEARATPNNQNISRVLDAIRNPVITRFDADTIKQPKDKLRKAMVVEPDKYPETYDEYVSFGKELQQREARRLKEQGSSSPMLSQLAWEQRGYTNENGDPALSRQEFEALKEAQQAFGLEQIPNVPPVAGDITSKNKRRPPEAQDPPSNGTEQMFLADFLNRQLGVSPDVLALANAASSPKIKEAAAAAQDKAVDNLAAREAYGEQSEIAELEKQARALTSMRDAVIKAEEIGLTATDILKGDELERQRQGLISMKGRTKVPQGKLDKDVVEFIRNYAELEDLQFNSPQMETAIQQKIAELDAARPDVAEMGLRFIAERGTANAGQGRKTAAKVLGMADRAGLNSPFLSQAGRDTYRFFINPNNPLNLGTPTLLAGSAALAGAGALLVDAATEMEIDRYDSPMATNYAKEVLRKADPEAVVYAIENSSLY